MTQRFIAGMIREYRSRAKKTLQADPKASAVYSCLADELASRAEAYFRRRIPMLTAVRESGYASDDLQQLLKSGQWTGMRMDLPKAPRGKTNG